MAKIYVCHSRELPEFKDTLYRVCNYVGDKYNVEFILPHVTDKTQYSKPIIKECDMMFAEISNVGTGLGIEIGWADAFNIPTHFLVRYSHKLSGSICAVIKEQYERDNKMNLSYYHEGMSISLEDRIVMALKDRGII